MIVLMQPVVVCALLLIVNSAGDSDFTLECAASDAVTDAAADSLVLPPAIATD